MGTLADWAAGTAAPSGKKEYKTPGGGKKKESMWSLKRIASRGGILSIASDLLSPGEGERGGIDQLRNLYGGIAQLPVDLAKSAVQASSPLILARGARDLARGDLFDFRDEEGGFDYYGTTARRLGSELPGEIVRSAGRTFVEQPIYNWETRLGQLGIGEGHQEMAGESILLQTLSPWHAKESAKGNLVGSAVEDIGNVTMAAAAAGALAGRVGNLAALPAAEAKAAELAAMAPGEIASGELSAAAARGIAKSLRPKGIAGRLAETNPKLASTVERLGHRATRISELGNRLDPIGGPLAAATKGLLPSTTLTPFDRLRGRTGDLVRTNLPSMTSLADVALPNIETVRLRRGLEAGVLRESTGAVDVATSASRTAEAAMKAEAARLDVPLTAASAREVLRRARGKAATQRTTESILDTRPEGIPDTLPTDVGTARRVAVAEAEGKWDSLVDSYLDAVTKGVGEQWLQQFDRSQSNLTDDLRVYGEDIKAMADYRKGTGIFEGVDGGLRRVYVDEFATKYRTDVQPARTEAELRGTGRTDAEVLGETQTERRRPTASRSVEGVTQDVEFGVTEEAITAERTAEARKMAKIQEKINKETPAAIRNTRISDVQEAVAKELATQVAEELPTSEEMRRRGASAQRVAAEEQKAAAGARKAQTTVRGAERTEAKLTERAKVAARESAEAQAHLKAAKPTKVPPRAASPEGAGGVPAPSKLAATTREIINRKIGEGPPTPKMEAAAQRLAARRLAARAEEARQAAEAAAKPAAAARKRASAAMEKMQITRGRGARAKVYAQATDAEKAADAVVRGRVTKDGRVTTTMTERVFRAAGARGERALSGQRRISRYGRDMAKTANRYQFVEEELSRSAQDLARQTGDAAMKTMKTRVAGTAGELGEVRTYPIKGKPGEVRLQLVGEMGKVVKEVDATLGEPLFNDALTANLVEKADRLKGPLTAREKMTTVIETMAEHDITITDEQMTRLQHSADVGEALERADAIIASRNVNGTWLGSPQIVAEALEEINWLPDDVRTRLRDDTANFLERQVDSLWRQKQAGAIPGFARSAGILGRTGVQNLIELARDANRQVPGSGDVYYQMALDIATNLDMMTAQGMVPVHVTGGAPPKIALTPEATVSQKALKSQFQKKTATAPLTPEELQVAEIEQAVTRVRNEGYRRARAEVSKVPADMPGFNQFAEEWKAQRGVRTMTDPQWGEAVDAWNKKVAKEGGDRKQRLKIIEPDAVDRIEFDRAKTALDLAKRRHSQVRQAEAGGTKLDYALDEATKKMDAAQARYDMAEIQMRPRLITEAIDDALTKWKSSASKDIPGILKPFARFNTWYKTWALALSPKWQVNQALGNPVMAMMFGGMTLTDMVGGPSLMRDITRPFNGDVQAALEAGRLDAGLADIMHALGVDVPANLLPGGAQAGIGIRGVENVESGITTSERRASQSVRMGGERPEPKTQKGRQLRDSQAAQAKAALSDLGFAMGAKRDAFWRSVVTLQNVEKLTEKWMRYDPESGFRKLRDRPLQVADLKAADIDRITATAHNEMLKWMGDFSRMSPFERRIMRHIVPFWSWIRHSNLAFARLHVYHPRRVVWMAHMAQLVSDPNLTDQERGILTGMIPIGDDNFFNLGALISPVPEDAGQSLLNPVWSGPSITQAMSPAINAVVAASLGISLGRGAQATRPGQVGSYFQPLLGEPRNLAGYIINKNLPMQFRVLRDVVQGPGPRFDTGQKKEGGVFRGPTGGRLGALAKAAGVPVPENLDLEKARG